MVQPLYSSRSDNISGQFTDLNQAHKAKEKNYKNRVRVRYAQSCPPLVKPLSLTSKEIEIKKTGRCNGRRVFPQYLQFRYDKEQQTVTRGTQTRYNKEHQTITRGVQTRYDKKHLIVTQNAQIRYNKLHYTATQAVQINVSEKDGKYISQLRNKMYDELMIKARSEYKKIHSYRERFDKN